MPSNSGYENPTVAQNSYTVAGDFIDIQVIGDFISQKLIKLVKLAPLAEIDNTLVGQAGMTITHPFYKYIGMAQTIDELDQVPVGNVDMDTLQATVKKAVKDLGFSDESILASNGAVLSEGTRQLAISIADKIDNDIVTLFRGATTTPQVTILNGELDFTQASLAKLKVAFGEDLEEATVLLINSTNYGKILAMPEFVAVMQGQAFMTGHVGHVMGLNIVVSDRLTDDEAYLVRQGAFAIAYKRHVQVESGRAMNVRGFRIGADVHYVTYLRDSSKLAKLTVADSVTP